MRPHSTMLWGAPKAVRREFKFGNLGGRIVRCARAVHKVCTGPYPSCIVVPSTSNNEPCHAFI